MNKIVEKVLCQACETTKDILCLIPKEGENLALAFSAPNMIKLSLEKDRKNKKGGKRK